jgi:hypothetical protein
LAHGTTYNTVNTHLAETSADAMILGRNNEELSCCGQRHRREHFERTATGCARPHPKARNTRRSRGRCEDVLVRRDRTKQTFEMLPGHSNRMGVHSARFTRAPGPRSKHSGTCQTKLFVAPNGRNRFLDFAANSATAPDSGPVHLSFDGESGECVVKCIGNAIELLKSMAGSYGESETFLATRDSGIVDRLDVNAMLLEKVVGCLLSLDSITDQGGHNMAGTGYDGDATLGKALLYFADVPLHELTVTVIRFLIDNRSMGTSDCDGRERSREDEARGIRANHVDELGRTGDITANGAIRFTKSTYKCL